MNVVGTFNRDVGSIEFLVTLDIVGEPANVNPFTKYEVELVFTALVGGVKVIECHSTGKTFLTDCGESMYIDAEKLWKQYEADYVHMAWEYAGRAVNALQGALKTTLSNPHGMFYGSFNEARNHLPAQLDEPVVMVLWQRDDITAYMQDIGDDRTPTTEQLDEMLLLIGNNHDASLGITWDTIDSAITAVMGRC